jgi:hypothetical protein
MIAQRGLLFGCFHCTLVNLYCPTLQTSQVLEVVENAPAPQKLILMLTLPIICPNKAAAASSKPCELEILIETTGGISVRQRFADDGVDPTIQGLLYKFKETDWKKEEKLAYNTNSTLEIVAKVLLTQFC